jgi:hypothetical protein
VLILKVLKEGDFGVEVKNFPITELLAVDASSA